MARPATNHETKKAEISAAALKSFAHYGYEGTSTKTIAEEGGFKSPALIYHYFPGGKFELFLACFEDFEPLKKFRDTLVIAEDTPPEEFFRLLARAYMQLLREDVTYQMLRIVVTEIPRIPELKAVFPQKMAPLLAYPIITYMSKLIMQGRLKPVNPLVLIMQLLGPLFTRIFLFRSFEENMPFPTPTDEELIETVVEGFVRANLLEPKTNL